MYIYLVFSYSGVFSVVYESDAKEVKLWPDPVGDVVTVSSQLTINDVYKRVVKSPAIAQGENILDMSRFPLGFYIFILQNGIDIEY